MSTQRVIAHRGLSSRAPENTMSAFRAAVEAGIKWIETDVDIIGDGTAVLIHDSSLDRTTNCRGRYNELTASDLPAIDAGRWFSPQFIEEPLPRLADLIDFMNETGVNANIEIKSNEEGARSSLQLRDSVIAELERLKPGRQVIVSSFNHVLLSKFKEAAPQWDVACLYETAALYDDWRSMLELVGDHLATSTPRILHLPSGVLRSSRTLVFESTRGRSTALIVRTNCSIGESME